MLYISHYIQIQKGKVYKDGALYFEDSNSEFKTFAKNLYQSLEVQYPKFYKMDNLCKLAFLASEIILADNTTLDVALIFSNKEGSFDTDIQHQQHIQHPDEFYPSPAIFVYTLPNICLGEISIRHNFQSESAFLIAEHYQTEYIRPYTDFLIRSGKAQKALCGWLKMIHGNYE